MLGFALTLMCSKISFLLLFLIIWPYWWIRRAVQVVLVITILVNVWIVISIFTACTPLDAFWDQSIAGAYCHPESVWWANNSMQLITTIMIFLLPFPVIFELHLPKHDKVIMTIAFVIGFL